MTSPSNTRNRSQCSLNCCRKNLESSLLKVDNHCVYVTATLCHNWNFKQKSGENLAKSSRAIEIHYIFLENNQAIFGSFQFSIYYFQFSGDCESFKTKLSWIDWKGTHTICEFARISNNLYPTIPSFWMLEALNLDIA